MILLIVFKYIQFLIFLSFWTYVMCRHWWQFLNREPQRRRKNPRVFTLATEAV